MRRDFREVLTAWVIGLLSLIAAAFLLTGCGAGGPTSASAESFTAVEMALVDNTARFAAQLGVKVRGEIVERDPWPSPEVGAVVGRYNAGVAYYVRPAVAKYVRLVPTPGCETAANVAAHEVCHSKHRAHDLAHWTCMAGLATPTYPRPE